jgi:hypothetical protein
MSVRSSRDCYSNAPVGIGHGLKDPDVAIAQSAKPVTVDAELASIERVIREPLKS